MQLFVRAGAEHLRVTRTWARSEAREEIVASVQGMDVAKAFWSWQEENGDGEPVE